MKKTKLYTQKDLDKVRVEWYARGRKAGRAAAFQELRELLEVPHDNSKVGEDADD